MLLPFLRREPDPVDLWAEADTLELEHGAEGAVRLLRARIVSAERETRARLYRLHDEIVRRHPGQDWWMILARP